MDELLASMLSLASLVVLHGILWSIVQLSTPVNSTPLVSSPQETPSLVNQMKLSSLTGVPSRLIPISWVEPSSQYDQQLSAPVLTVVKSAAKHWTSASLTLVPTVSPMVLNLG